MEIRLKADQLWINSKWVDVGERNFMEESLGEYMKVLADTAYYFGQEYKAKTSFLAYFKTDFGVSANIRYFDYNGYWQTYHLAYLFPVYHELPENVRKFHQLFNCNGG